MLKEFKLCPRAFYYRRIQNLSLPPDLTIKDDLNRQIMIDHLTEIFYSSLSSLTKKEVSFKTRSKLDNFIRTFVMNYIISKENLNEMNSPVFSFLNWVTQDIWVTLSRDFRRKKYFIPIMVNRIIQDPDSGFVARPSMVFMHDNSKVTPVIQTFESLINSSDLISIEAAICSKILKSMGFSMTNILYVNYFNMNITYRAVTSSDYKSLEDLLRYFRLKIEGQEFEHNRSEYCHYCEFRLLCNN